MKNKFFPYEYAVFYLFSQDKDLTTPNSQFIRALFDAYAQIFYHFKLLITIS